MEQYISKSAVVEEIERLQDAIKATAIDDRISKEQAEAYKVCVKLRSFVEDTLEVKEVDLEKEIECSLPKPAWGWNEDYLGKSDPAYSMEQMKELAKHFFELGLKAQKGGLSYDSTGEEMQEPQD